MRKPLSVKQFNEYFKSNIKHDPIFQNLYINGQLANVRINNSHLYFSLKEDNEIIDCVIYYYQDKDIDFDFEVGVKVNVKGNIFYNNYSSKVVISVRDIYEQGLGEEYRKFLEMKETFKKLGYFDPEIKKDIPKYPQKIGLITSKDGAAVVDFVSVINQKPNDMEIYLNPVKVQGLDSYQMVEKAINDLDKMDLDLLVITRGGGSEEDLSTFNNKEVIEAAFRARSPLISAIGHKIDQTLLDLVSDLSLQTPTEAGSFVIRFYANIEKDMRSNLDKMRSILNYQIDKVDKLLSLIDKRLNKNNPKNKLDRKRLELRYLKKDLDNMLNTSFSINEDRLRIIKMDLDKQKNIIDLKKDMIEIKNAKFENIYSSKSLNIGDEITIEFSDGKIKAEIIDG